MVSFWDALPLFQHVIFQYSAHRVFLGKANASDFWFWGFVFVGFGEAENFCSSLKGLSARGSSWLSRNLVLS